MTLVLAFVGLAAVARRFYVLIAPPHVARFTAGAALDRNFAAHQLLTFAHILPAALLIVLMPLQFVRRVRDRHIQWHRFSLTLLGAETWIHYSEPRGFPNA